MKCQIQVRLHYFQAVQTMKSPQKGGLAQLFHPLRKQVLLLPYQKSVLFHRTLDIWSFDQPYFNFLTIRRGGFAS